jgi:hypothetical protein
MSARSLTASIVRGWRRGLAKDGKGWGWGKKPEGGAERRGRAGTGKLEAPEMVVAVRQEAKQ